MKIVALILAILKAIPTLDKWYREIMLEYTRQRIAENDKEFRNALEKAKVSGDLKALRDGIGKLAP